ncbi:MAG: SdrD B-like domain-containing protein, partial [Bacteroidota bacterium]
VITELLFCPVNLDFETTVRLSTVSSCLDPAKAAALNAAGMPCNMNEAMSSYEYISEEAEIQAEWVIEPVDSQALCEIYDYSIRVKNVKPGLLVDVLPEIWFPDGIEFVPGSWTFTFPGGPTTTGTAVSVPDPTAIPGDDSAFGTAYQYTDDAAYSGSLFDNGFEGVSFANLTEDENAFLLSFQAITTCDEFVSGTPLRFEVTAADPCEARITSGVLESNPLIIDNANPIDFAQLIASADPVEFNCGETTTLTLYAINIAEEGETGMTRACFTLPNESFTYVGGSVAYTSPVGFDPNEMVTTTTGSTEICIDVPDGIGPGQFFSVTLDVGVNDTDVCGVKQIGFDVASLVEDQACATEIDGMCDVFVSNNINKIIDVEFAPPLNIEDIELFTECPAGGAATVEYTYSVTVENPGAAFNNDVTIEVREDVNENGELDAFDPVLDMDVQAVNLPNGGTDTLMGSLMLPATRNCKLLVNVIQTTSCVCTNDVFAFDEVLPSFFGELDDNIVLCPGDDLMIDFCDGYSLALVPINAGTITIAGDNSTATVSLNAGFGIDSPVKLQLSGDIGGCTVNEEKDLFQLQDDTPDPVALLVCSNSSTRIDLDLPSALTDDAIIEWSPAIELSATDVIDPEVVNPTMNRTYTYTLTYPSTGCVVTGTVNTTVAPSPTVAPTAVDVCPGETAELVANAAGGTGTLSYAWTGPNGFASTEENPSIPFFTADNSGTYRVIVTDENGCRGLATVGVVALDCGALGNYVWVDENSDGLQDAGEPGIPNVKIYLYGDPDGDGTTELMDSTATDANGGYLFPNLPAGSYYVDVLDGTGGTENTMPDTNLVQTTPSTLPGADFGNQDHNTTAIPDNPGLTGYQIDLGSGDENLTGDFGYNYNPDPSVNNDTGLAALGDRVWIDSDGDGRQDPSEVGVSGVEITMTGAGPDGRFGTADDTTATTTTDENGFYIFDDLPPGSYVTEVTDDAGASHDVLDMGMYAQT